MTLISSEAAPLDLYATSYVVSHDNLLPSKDTLSEPTWWNLLLPLPLASFPAKPGVENIPCTMLIIIELRITPTHVKAPSMFHITLTVYHCLYTMYIRIYNAHWRCSTYNSAHIQTSLRYSLRVCTIFILSILSIRIVLLICRLYFVCLPELY